MQTVKHKIPVLAVLVIVFSGITFSWIFLETVENIWFQERMVQLDVQVIQCLQERHTALGDKLFSRITHLGNPFLLAAIATITSIILLLRGRKLESLLLAGGFVSLTVVVIAVKFLLDRHRPSEVAGLVIEYSPAFPSGHASMSLFLYVFLAYLIARKVSGLQKKLAILLIAVLLASMIGFSRLYLAVHWPSDVFGGFALAGVWLSVLALVIETQHPRDSRSEK